MNIRSIIIDDEPNNIENLQAILHKYCAEVEVIAIANSADDGIAAIKTHQPDLLFLDIQMPEKSGFDVLKAFSALDYLLKPIDINELKLSVDKARHKIAAKQKNNNIENLLEYIKSGHQAPPKIALPTLQEIMYVKVSDIVRCEASNNYTLFYLQSGENILVCKTLKEFAELLKPYNFVRTHQSHLINLYFVKSYLKEDGGSLFLNDRTKIPISRQNRDLVKDALSKSLK
jgi:two-component system LytT family response regulator